jgi:hypothetical protein
LQTPIKSGVIRSIQRKAVAHSSKFIGPATVLEEKFTQQVRDTFRVSVTIFSKEMFGNADVGADTKGPIRPHTPTLP